jgi:hypothetical protein
MIQAINTTITRIFDVLLTPFKFLGDFWELLFLSILLSLIVLLVFKWVSSPKKIKEAKNQIKSSILAIRLYKDFWKVITLSFIKSLFYTLKYFLLNFGPVLILLPFLLPFFVQMDVRYGMRPFEVGEIFSLEARFDTNVYDLDIALLDNDHFKPVMKPVFINAYKDEDRTIPIQEVDWKLKALRKGQTDIRIRVGDQIITKSLVIGKYHGALSNKKFRRSGWSHFLYPVEAVFRKSDHVEAVIMQYPHKSVSVLGLRTHWLLIHLVLVLVIVLGLRKRFGVEF